jgi:hypothetical protein
MQSATGFVFTDKFKGSYHMDNTFSDVQPWPTTPPQAAGSQLGHNRPPLNEVARSDFNEAIDKKQGFRSRIEALLSSIAAAKCETEDDAGRCGELMKQCRAAEVFVEETHKVVKDDYLTACREVDGLKTTMIGPIKDAKTKVQQLLNSFAAREQARRDEQIQREREQAQARARAEQDRLEALGVPEEQAAEIAVPVAVAVPEHVKIRGDYGATVSTRKEWTFEVVDYETAVLEVAKNSKVREAVESAIKGMVRAGEREIKGVRIFQITKAGVR